MVLHIVSYQIDLCFFSCRNSIILYFSWSSVKLVEQELWQREDKGLIGVLPVRDSEAAAVGTLLSQG
jgi:hypothetical protein